MMVGRLLSFWEGIFSGAMLNFRSVNIPFVKLAPDTLGLVQMSFRSVRTVSFGECKSSEQFMKILLGCPRKLVNG